MQAISVQKLPRQLRELVDTLRVGETIELTGEDGKLDAIVIAVRDASQRPPLVSSAKIDAWFAELDTLVSRMSVAEVGNSLFDELLASRR
jgi:hypothetical protein